MEIIPANEEDYKQCLIIAKQSKHIRAFVSTSFRWGWKNELFVAKENGKVLGFVNFHLLKRKPQSTLYYIIVDKDSKGKGIGGELFRYYETGSWGKRLCWRVAKGNDEAIKFYSNMGYEPKRIDEKGDSIYE